MRRLHLPTATVLLLGSVGTIFKLPLDHFLTTTTPTRIHHDNQVNNSTADIRYYIYPEESISKRSNVLTAAMSFSSSDEPCKYCCRDAFSELAVHGALERHPLRTMDPTQAELFIVPTPIDALVSFVCWEHDKHNCTDFDEAFDALTSHSIFQNDDMGKHHIIINLHWFPFSHKHRHEVPVLSRNYHKLKNTILANRFDPLAVQRLTSSRRAQGNDFERYFHRQGTLVTRAGFSMASGLEQQVPLVAASLERFDKSRFFLFYRTRSKPFRNHSTKYRFAPLNYTEELQPSSIGHDLPKEEWLDHFQSSQFCLVIRGDSPETHALAHSVKSGCIPVVVSDWYPEWAGPFKSTLNMNDFCIFIREENFIANPLAALQGLKQMERNVLESKIKALAHAQRVMFPDHPQSLFVPAFLKEAKNAIELADRLKTDAMLPY